MPDGAATDDVATFQSPGSHPTLNALASRGLLTGSDVAFAGLSRLNDGLEQRDRGLRDKSVMKLCPKISERR
jgi:hypothetical protein